MHESLFGIEDITNWDSISKQYMTEISSLYSFGKVILLSNRIPICDVFYAEKAFMHYIIYL